MVMMKNMHKVKLASDAFKLLDYFFGGKLPIQGHSLAGYALKGNAKKIADELYGIYSTNFQFKMETPIDEVRKLEERFKAEQEIAIRTMMADHIVKDKDYSFAFESSDGAWLFRCFKGVGHSRYRLYCNIHIPSFSSFIKHFINYVFTYLACPACGSAFLHFNRGHNDIRCGTCGYELESFNFKIGTSKLKNAFLRNDKVVIYLQSDIIMEPIIKILKALKGYFSPATPSLTHEIFPGLGYSTNPGKTEAAEYNEVCKEEKEKVSFGEWLTTIIADHFVKFVKKNEDIFRFYYKGLNRYDRKALKEYYTKKLRPLMIHYYVQSAEFIADARLEKHFAEIEKMKERMMAIA